MTNSVDPDQMASSLFAKVGVVINSRIRVNIIPTGQLIYQIWKMGETDNYIELLLQGLNSFIPASFKWTPPPLNLDKSIILKGMFDKWQKDKCSYRALDKTFYFNKKSTDICFLLFFFYFSK